MGLSSNLNFITQPLDQYPTGIPTTSFTLPDGTGDLIAFQPARGCELGFEIGHQRRVIDGSGMAESLLQSVVLPDQGPCMSG